MKALFERVTILRALPTVVVILTLVTALTVLPSKGPTVPMSRAALATVSPAGFISRQGAQLILNGSTFKFGGVNADAMFGCWPGEQNHTDAQLDQFFGGLHPQSVVRVFMMHGASIAIMDQLVAAAARHGDFLDASLAEANGNCDDLGAKDGNWFAGGYRRAYWDWIKQIIPRYAASPAIGFWEIINEPPDNPNLKNMFNDTATLIKSLDPNHLVGTGTLAAWAYRDYAGLAAGPNIDLISMHEYDGGTVVSGWAAEAIAAAQADNKPFYVGEFGYSRDANAGIPAMPWIQRSPEMLSKFNAYLAIPECAGAIYWDFKLEAQYAPDSAGDAMTFGDAGFAALPSINVPRAVPVGPPPPSTSVGAVLVDDNAVGTTDGLLNYSAGWIYNPVNDRAKYDGDDHYTEMAGAVVTFHFNGVRAQLYGARAAWHGIAAFSVDGGVAKSVDLYAPTRSDQVLMFDTGILPTGEHTVTMQATGTHGANANGAYVSLDRAAFEVAANRTQRTTNDDATGTADGLFGFSSAWIYNPVNDPAKYDGDDHYTDVAGAVVTFRFNGTSAQLYGARAAWHGIGAVSVDGGSVEAVDLYAPTRSDQVLLFDTGTLPAGEHTITMRATGTHDIGSTGTYISIDYATYAPTG